MYQTNRICKKNFSEPPTNCISYDRYINHLLDLTLTILLNRVGSVVTWVAWVTWVKFFCVGPNVFAWVFAWIKIFYVGPKFLRWSTFIY